MRLVLDTNVVLDWLVWNDPFVDPLRERVRDGRVVVVTHGPALDELRRVLGYPDLKLDAARQGEIFARYREHSTATGAQHGELSPGEGIPLPAGFPRCRDRDDQHFVVLAYQAKVDALVSRDKAVLKLRRKCHRFGFAVLNVPQMIEALARL